VGKPEGKNQLEDPGTERRIILKRVFWKWDGDMDWIDVAQDRDSWCALEKTVMKLRVQ
jgi:hypothetical protein